MRNLPDDLWDVFAATPLLANLSDLPQIPQIILFNKNGVERWERIEKAFKKAGRKVCCIGFDDTTDMQAFSKEIEEAFNLL